MSNVLVGTASWADKTLVESGLFYPAMVKSAEDRLRYYATQFPVVEVDSSYYAMPTARNSMLWLERTPPTFVFDIKAFRLFTQHPTPLQALPKDIRNAFGRGEKNVYYADMPGELRAELWLRFNSAIAPLHQAGKLGLVLFQFPPWFVYRQSHLEHILHCAEFLECYQLAIEFRHQSWFAETHKEQVLSFQRRLGLIHVAVDEPQGFANSIPSIWEVTCPKFVVVRFHGRNRQAWDQKGTLLADRFNYLYSEEELLELAEQVRRLAASAGQIHVFFNNNVSGYAQRNAADFRRMVD
jgi:uncharacterized protein YecE (DUF72 family)